MSKISDVHAAVSPFLDDIRQREAGAVRAAQEAVRAARAEGFRAGAEAMREAAARSECKYCRDGVPLDGRGHHDRTSGTGPWLIWTNLPNSLTCRGAHIRSLPIPEDRT